MNSAVTQFQTEEPKANLAQLEPLLVNKKTACKLLSLGETKLNELLKEERLTKIKEGRKVLITMASIRNYAGGDS